MTSLVLGILAVVLTFVCIGPLLAIPAIICGHIAFSRINRSGGLVTGKGMAIAGFVTGYVSLAFLVLLLPIALPNFIRARNTAQKNACINNLRILDGAKQQWALEKAKTDEDTPTKEELLPYLHNKFPVCPAGGVYTIRSVAERPTCSIEGHEIPEL